MRRLTEYVNLSYDSEATIAAQIGAGEGAVSGWLTGKVEPTFQWFLKVRDFLERQVKKRSGIVPISYVPPRGTTPTGGEVRGEE